MSRSPCIAVVVSQDSHIERASLVPAAEVKRLGFLDRYLTVWVFTAMSLGVIIGATSPSAVANVNSWSSDGINWPIAVGLILMMYPPLARVDYDEVMKIIKCGVIKEKDRNCDKSNLIECNALELARSCAPQSGNLAIHNEFKEFKHIASEHSEPGSRKFTLLLAFSALMNWVVGPVLMFFLALMWLPDQIPYIRGLVMVGIARCIAMVIVWIDLADGSPEHAAILVCLNSAFQVVFYSAYAYLFISVFLAGCHLPHAGREQVSVSFALVAQSVAVYLGIPFALGLGSWLTFNKLLGGREPAWRVWYKDVFIPRTEPLTLLALLFTILIMFILKGHMIIHLPVAVLRVSLPMCFYFVLMFVGTYYCCHRLGFSRAEAVTLAFTSASTNFELAIAVSIAVYGLDSPEAFVCVIGALVEVPVMLSFVSLEKVLHRRWPTPSSEHGGEEGAVPEMTLELRSRPIALVNCTSSEAAAATITATRIAADDCEDAISPMHPTQA